MHDLIVQLFQDYIQTSVLQIMMPTMVGVFFLAVFIRFCLYYSAKREKWFVNGFSIRVFRYLDSAVKQTSQSSFNQMLGAILRKTHEELFIIRATQRKRRFDKKVSMIDRLFLVEAGVKRLMHDTLLKTRYLKNNRHSNPKFFPIAKYVLFSNPTFNKLFGVFPVNLTDDLLNILPGIFIIGGLLGTFIGILGGLPDLKAMDVTDIDSASATLNSFLSSMGFAMISSVFGIFLSILFTIVNTVLSFYGIYEDILESYSNSLEFIWKETESHDALKGQVHGPGQIKKVVGREHPHSQTAILRLKKKGLNNKS